MYRLISNANYEDLDWVTMAQDRFQWHPMLIFLVVRSLNLAIQILIYELKSVTYILLWGRSAWGNICQFGTRSNREVAILRNE
jgi:hypothetical protein